MLETLFNWRRVTSELALHAISSAFSCATLSATLSATSCALIISVTTHPAAAAATTPSLAQIDDCNSMLEVPDCLALRFERAETDIAALLKQTEQGGDSKVVSAMLKSQQAWLRYRESHCGLEAAIEGATGANAEDARELAEHSCRTRMSEARSEEVRGIIPLPAFSPQAAAKNAARNAR